MAFRVTFHLLEGRGIKNCKHYFGVEVSMKIQSAKISDHFKGGFVCKDIFVDAFSSLQWFFL